MPVTTPWLNMTATAPLRPSAFIDAMPSMTKPMCDTDEYATSFFRSVCANATAAP